MRFLTEKVEQLNRRTETIPVYSSKDNPPGHDPAIKREVIILKVHMVGDGDTRRFTSAEITAIVLDKIKGIYPHPLE